MGCASSVIQTQTQPFDHILHLARSSTSSDQVKAAKYMAQVGGKDDDASKSEKKALIDGGAITLLVRMVCSKDTEVQLSAIAALQHYSVEKSWVTEIVNVGGTRILVALTASKKAKLRLPAMLVLKNMCKLEEVYKELVEIWPMKDFRALLDTEADNLDLDMEHMAYSILFYMTKVEECAATMVLEGGMQALLNDVRNPFKQLFHKIPAAKVFANLAASVRNHGAIVKLDGIRDMLALIKFPNLDLQLAGIQALAALSANPAWKDTVVDEGSPEAVFELMASQPDPALLCFCALTIRNLIHLPQVQVAVVRMRAMRKLIELTRCGHKDTEVHAVVAVATLASTEEYRQRVVDEKGLEALLPYAQMDSDSDPVVVRCSRDAIWPEADADTAQAVGAWTGSSSPHSPSSADSTVVSHPFLATTATSGRSFRERDHHLLDESAAPIGRALSNKERGKQATMVCERTGSHAQSSGGAHQSYAGLEPNTHPHTDTQVHAGDPAAAYVNGGNTTGTGRGRGRPSTSEAARRDAGELRAASEQCAQEESPATSASRTHGPAHDHDSCQTLPQPAAGAGPAPPGGRWMSPAASYSSAASAGDPRRGHNYSFSPGPPSNTYRVQGEYHHLRALYRSTSPHTPHCPTLSPPTGASHPASPNHSRRQHKSHAATTAAQPYAYAGHGSTSTSSKYLAGVAACARDYHARGAAADGVHYMSSRSYAPAHPHVPHMVLPPSPSVPARSPKSPLSGCSSSSQRSWSRPNYHARKSPGHAHPASLSTLHACDAVPLVRRGWGYVPAARA